MNRCSPRGDLLSDMEPMPRTPDQIYEEWLVLRAQDGSRPAMGELVTRWNRRLVGFALSQTGREDIARDVAQSAWLAAARDIRRLRDPAAFGAWILRIVANRCADHIRAASRARRAEHAATRDRAIQIANPAPAADDSETVTRVREAIAMLGPAQREILGLHYGAGLRVDVIASLLGVPEGTIKSRLHAARNELKPLLERTNQ